MRCLVVFSSADLQRVVLLLDHTLIASPFKIATILAAFQSGG
jgi:hypothetical protein